MKRMDFKYCDDQGCNYKTKYKNHLNRHKANVHDIGVKFYYCNFGDCKYKCKDSSSLKRHKSFVHDIEVKWYYCDIKDCDFKCKAPAIVRRHKSNIHGVGVKWHYCDIKDCDFKCKTANGLKEHKARIHEIVEKWHHCDVCNKKYSTHNYLMRHKKRAHNIGVIWYRCQSPNCEYKTTDLSNLKRHRSFIHDIDVKLFSCDVEGCHKKFKASCALKCHKSSVHDIGKHQCNFCLHNKNSSIIYEDQQGKHHICRTCYKKITGKKSRIEKQMSDYLDETLGIHFLLGSDDSFRSMGGCSKYRPDKLYGSGNLVIHIECDEYQHKKKNGDYTCDERRISDIYDEFPGKTHLVIRWNPHHYKSESKRPVRKERLRLLANLFNKLKTIQHKDPIHIYYMFYSKDNPRIAKKIPYTFIYTNDDINCLET